MNIYLKQNREGVDEFIKTFKDNSPNIDNFLKSESYIFFINTAGENFLKPTVKDWDETFRKAYINFKNDKKAFSENLFENLIFKSINYGLEELENLSEITYNIIKIIEEKIFINKALKFLPEIKQDITINIKYLIFGHNAMVESNTIFIDIPFFSKLTKEEINDIMAHEMHHYLKQYIKTNYNKNNKYPKTNQFIKTLENEGIANLCNYSSTDRIYNILGLFNGYSVITELENVDKYLLNFFTELNTNIKRERDSDYSKYLDNFNYIPMSYYIADKILKELGKEKLISTVGKPYRFLRMFLNIYDFEYKNILLKSLKKIGKHEEC